MAVMTTIEKIAMIGCGSMGGGMALLFAEKGLDVSLSDPNNEAMDGILAQAHKEGFGNRMAKYEDYASLAASLGTPRVIFFSLPHGDVGDTVLNGLLPYLDVGDVILDAGNEKWTHTERRQGITATKGIRYIGVGVSGGYQAARRGPSMCPGGDRETVEMVLPLLRKAAAKDARWIACVGHAGYGGSGHYVKMIHNGIEHGMMSAISEAWHIMSVGLEMNYAEIGDVFDKWNSEAELRNTFLIKIGADICRTKNQSSGEAVLATVLDKVVQDITGEEGTGMWSNMEAVRLHVPAPTLSTAHFLRLASAYRGTRERFRDIVDGGFQPKRLNVENKGQFLEHLRIAVYTACLAAYVQGINVIDAADRENKWSISYADVWQIWRAGCIIQADYISDLLEPAFRGDRGRTDMNLLFETRVARELKKGYEPLKQVVGAGLEADLVVPALGATLEYIKYESNTELPTQFYEAELDYFGKHMFDEKGENAPNPTAGTHHFEWKPA